MSLFGRKPPPASSSPVPVEREPAPAQDAASSKPNSKPQSEPLFDGSNVDIKAIYRSAKLTGDELDRVARAEGLLHLLPGKASKMREVVDATFLAFGVDRKMIIDAATKQLDALEGFIRFSQDQTQAVLDVGAKRIAELEAEIERCRQAAALATREAEDRARTVNSEMVKVQHVLDFFGDEGDEEEDSVVLLEQSTSVNNPGSDAKSGPSVVKPQR